MIGGVPIPVILFLLTPVFIGIGALIYDEWDIIMEKFDKWKKRGRLSFHK